MSDMKRSEQEEYQKQLEISRIEREKRQGKNPYSTGKPA